MKQLAELMRLPWTFIGPTKIIEDGQECWELRIAELPDFLVAGTTREEVYQELRPGLEAFLNSYLELGQDPPEPAPLETGDHSARPVYAWQVVDVRAAQPRPIVRTVKASHNGLPGVTASRVTGEGLVLVG